MKTIKMCGQWITGTHLANSQRVCFGVAKCRAHLGRSHALTTEPALKEDYDLLVFLLRIYKFPFLVYYTRNIK